MLAVVIAAGLLIIGGLLIYGILVTPQRQPYRDALAQYENANRALSATSVSVNASTASDEDFNKGIEAVEAALNSLQIEVDALGEEEVLTTGEGKELFDAYNERITLYIAYNNDVVESMKVLRPILLECSELMDGIESDSAGATAMQTCADEMDKAETVPDADYQVLAEAFGENYQQLADTFKEKQAIIDAGQKDSDRYRELVAEQSTILEDFNNDGTNFATDVKNTRETLLATDSARLLLEYLKDESRVF